MAYTTHRLPSDAAYTGGYVRTWERGNTNVTGRIDAIQQQGSRQGLVFAMTHPVISATATASLRIAALINPTASGKTAYVHRVKLKHWAVAAAATVVTFNMARTTDLPAGGTAITPSRINQSATAPVCSGLSIPTSGTLETGVIDAIGSEIAAAAPREYLLWDGSVLWDEHIEVVAGRGLLIQTTGTPDTDHRFVPQWVWEEI